MSGFFGTAWLVARKDLTVEVRSRELLYTTLFFALSCVLVFAVAFVREGRPLGDAAAGILWIAIAFSGTLALGRTFERERYSDTLRALMLAPAPRAAVYVGKLIGIVALLAATEIVIVPLVALLFQAPLFRHPGLVAALLLSGTVGFGASGTLFAAMLARARSRDVLLPILLYPITIPVMIAGVRGTGALLELDPDLAMAAVLDHAARVLRRRVRDAGAVDVRTAHDGVGEMRRLFPIVMALAGAAFLCGTPAHRTRAAGIDDGTRAEDLLLPHAYGHADAALRHLLRRDERRAFWRPGARASIALRWRRPN